MELDSADCQRSSRLICGLHRTLTTKAIALEQRWRLGNRGNGIGEALAHIERSGMATPDEPLVSVFCSTIVLFVERAGHDVRCFGELLDHPRCARDPFTCQYHPPLRTR